MSTKSLLIFLVLAFSLSSCSTTPEQCDPRNANAGFLNKLNCTSQGTYAQRVEQKERILLDEQRANQLFREVYAALQEEQQQVGQQRRQQQAQHTALNRSLNALLAEISNKAKGNQRIEAEIAQVEQEIARLNQQQNPSVVQRRHELQQLQQHITDLETDLGLR